MRDPHVETLHYEAYAEQAAFVYRNPPNVDWVTASARYLLGNGQLTAWPTAHYATKSDAAAALQPDLDAWEASADLEASPGVLRFRLKDAVIRDCNPAPVKPGSVVIAGSTAIVTATGFPATLTLSRHDYPAPPDQSMNFGAPIVPLLIDEYRAWRHNDNDGFVFLARPYAMLTLLEREAAAGVKRGKRSKAAGKYRANRTY